MASPLSEAARARIQMPRSSSSSSCGALQATLPWKNLRPAALPSASAATAAPAASARSPPSQSEGASRVAPAKAAAPGTGMSPWPCSQTRSLSSEPSNTGPPSTRCRPRKGSSGPMANSFHRRPADRTPPMSCVGLATSTCARVVSEAALQMMPRTIPCCWSTCVSRITARSKTDWKSPESGWVMSTSPAASAEGASGSTRTSAASSGMFAGSSAPPSHEAPSSAAPSPVLAVGSVAAMASNCKEMARAASRRRPNSCSSASKGKRSARACQQFCLKCACVRARARA
mmetsp:Transcript_166324/g.534170  ORF Transcript_166324/g.534170 Transcript_166324/m.534170 type:complete len:287 (+) Transcript_166324:108-968(+)